MRILCTADLHIGRISSRLPPEANSAAFTARAAWARVVDLALKEKVHVVAVAGDVIDESGNYFEAFGPLEAGLRKLSDARIEVFFVAGNHDFDSLPRFFNQFHDPRAHLLGRDGNWQRHTLERDGERMHIDGWSFPRKAYNTNPLNSYRCERDGAPVLGLLHADVGQPSSYAPCSGAELLAAGPAVWLLGHVHRAREFPSGAALAFYPGSPQALDPGEDGAHGAKIIEWPAAGVPALRHCPISTIRYEQFDLTVDGRDDEPAIEEALHCAMAEQLQECAADAGPVEVLISRVRLCGHTAIHSKLARYGWPRVDNLEHSAHGIKARIESVEVNTRPTLDLDALAQGNSPPAILSRLLLALDRGEDLPPVADMHQRLAAAFRVMTVDGDGAPGGEGAPAQESPDAEGTRALLLKQGHRLLAQLVDTKP